MRVPAEEFFFCYVFLLLLNWSWSYNFDLGLSMLVLFPSLVWWDIGRRYLFGTEFDLASTTVIPYGKWNLVHVGDALVVVVLEGVPRNISYHEMKDDLLRLSGVEAVHSLNIWSLTMDKVVVSVHLAVGMLYIVTYS